VAALHDAGTGATVVFYASLGAFVLLEQRTRIRSVRNRDGARSDRGSILVVIAAVTIGIVGAFLVADDVRGAAIGSGRWGFFAVGIGLMWAGIVIRQWSIAALGRFFTIDVRVQPGQPVVDGGPYRWVRHPSYSGMILTLSGLGLALGNWLSLALLAVVPTVGLIIRIRVEERALLDALGEPYERFAASRKRLVPGLW
jgi:protein-S-isoprenylcysteine O-methyltransferase Ste14